MVTYVQSVGEELKLIRIKFDNYSSQYKSKRVFRFYQKLWEALDKKVIVYYGVAGHGKGIVDTRSSFCVKEPLRKEIARKDFWYTTFKEIFDFLSKTKGSHTVKYFYIPEDKRRERKDRDDDVLKIDGCMKEHIVFSPHHSIQTKVNICSCEDCIEANLINCSTEKGKLAVCADESDGGDSNGEIEEFDDGNEEDEDEDADSEKHEMKSSNV